MVKQKEKQMKDLAIKTLEVVWTAFWAILLAPFLIPAFAICKLLGADPMSLDGMGFNFIFMIMIAVFIFIGAAGFVLGYFL